MVLLLSTLEWMRVLVVLCTLTIILLVLCTLTIILVVLLVFITLLLTLARIPPHPLLLLVCSWRLTLDLGSALSTGDTGA